MKQRYSGKQVLNKIRSGIHELEKQEKAAGKKVRGAEESIDRLMHDRETVYATLAQVYLPELSQNAIASLHARQDDVHRIFEERAQRLYQLEDRMKENRNGHALLRESVDQQDESLEKLTGELIERQATILNELKEDSRYLQLLKEQKEAEEKGRSFDGQNKMFTDEAKRQRRQYEGNQLFMYLWKKESNGGSLGIIGRLDHWLARQINYETAKQNYEILTSLPDVLKERLAVQKRIVQELTRSLQDIVAEKDERHGAAAIKAQAQNVVGERKNAVQRMGELDAIFKRYNEERDDLYNTKGSHYTQAIGELKSYLKASDIAELRRKAEETPTPEDDRLVQRLEDIDGKIKRLKKECKQYQKEQHQAANQIASVRESERQFTQRGYGRSDHYFNDINDGFIDGFLMGQITNDMFDSHLHSHHYYDAPSYHDSGDSDSGFFSGGGSSGSDFFSGGGDFGGGGDFFTGGGD